MRFAVGVDENFKVVQRSILPDDAVVSQGCVVVSQEDFHANKLDEPAVSTHFNLPILWQELYSADRQLDADPV